MKKAVTILISVCLLLPAIQLKAQVKIGDNPTTIGASSILELEKSDKALVVTRVDDIMSIVNPTNGMIIYDKSMECFRVYQNGKWSECIGEYIAPPPPDVNGLGCTGATIAPSSALLNTPFNGTVIVPYYYGNGGVYPAQLIPSTGVLGLTAQLLAGTLNSAAEGSLYLTVTGTPKSTGNALFALTLGGHNCIFNIPVTYPAAVASTNCDSYTWIGDSLTAGIAAVGNTAKVPYIDGNGGYYNALAISSTGVTGLVASSPSGYLETGYGILSLSISGTPRVSGIAQFILNFAGTTCNLRLDVAPGGPVVSGFNCSSTTFSPGTVYAGTSYSGTATIPYSGGNGQPYGTGAAIPSTGVTGLTATLQAGTLANGNGTLTYAISGTPNADGVATFSIVFGGQTCDLNTTITYTPATLPAGIGTFTGKTCFDIARGNDNLNGCSTLASRIPQRSDFTQATTYTQTYTFTPTGAVSNVRFVYVNTNGDVITSVSGNNMALNITTPVIATVNYNDTLNTLAQGLTYANPLTANIYVVYNDKGDGTGAERQLKIAVQVKDCACCGAYIAPGVWKTFMCHNLGADPNVDVFTDNTYRINGAYIQWGKRGPMEPTGNSVIDWQTAPSDGAGGFVAAPTSGTIEGAHTGAIAGWNTQFSTPDGAWTPITKTINDPCPPNFRIPSYDEWLGVAAHNSIRNIGVWDCSYITYTAKTFLGNDLCLPMGLARAWNDGTLSCEGVNTTYWSSEGRRTTDRAYALYVNGAGQPMLYAAIRIWGFLVRCIAE